MKAAELQMFREGLRSWGFCFESSRLIFAEDVNQKRGAGFDGFEWMSVGSWHNLCP